MVYLDGRAVVAAPEVFFQIYVELASSDVFAKAYEGCCLHVDSITYRLFCEVLLPGLLGNKWINQVRR